MALHRSDRVVKKKSYSGIFRVLTMLTEEVSISPMYPFGKKNEFMECEHCSFAEFKFHIFYFASFCEFFEPKGDSCTES